MTTPPTTARENGMVADDALLRGIVACDDAALACVMARDGQAVYDACWRILREHHAAVDATQSTFVILVRRARGLTPGLPLLPWLIGTAQRCALVAARSRDRRRRHEREAGRLQATFAPSPREPADIVDPAGLSTRTAMDAVHRLPTHERTVILLRYLEGLSSLQIARQLMIPEETVHTRLRRGLARLRQRLRVTDLSLGLLLVRVHVGQPLTPPPVPGTSGRLARTAIVGCSIAAVVGVAIAVSAHRLPSQVPPLPPTAVRTMATLPPAPPPLHLVSAGGGQDAASPIASLVWATPAHLLSGDYEGRLWSWPLPTGQPQRLRAGPSSLHARLQPDGQILWVGLGTGGIERWNLHTHLALPALADQPLGIKAITMAPDGTWIATAGSAGEVHIRRGRDGTLLRSIRTGQGIIWDLAASPNGRELAVAGDAWAASIYDVRTGEQHRTLSGHADCLRACAWSPDGTELITGSNDQTVRRWSVDDGSCRAVVHCRALIGGIAWSPQGWIAAGDVAGAIYLWRPGGEAQATRTPAHHGAILCLSVAADGIHLASGGADEWVRWWTIAGQARVNQSAGF